MVVLVANHEVYSTDSSGGKIYDILLSGSGDAYAFRDGQGYQVKWQRNDPDVVSLTNPDGTPFAFKPGATWFEVIGISLHDQANRSELALHPSDAVAISKRATIRSPFFAYNKFGWVKFFFYENYPIQRRCR